MKFNDFDMDGHTLEIVAENDDDVRLLCSLAYCSPRVPILFVPTDEDNHNCEDVGWRFDLKRTPREAAKRVEDLKLEGMWK